MLKEFLILAFLAQFQFILSEKVRYDNYTVYSVIPRNEKDLKVLKQIEYNVEFWHEPTTVGKSVDIMVSPEYEGEFRRIILGSSMELTTFISNVQDLIDKENPRKKAFGVQFDQYNTLEEINNWLKELPNQYPEAEVLTVGRSYEGRDILGIKISYNSENANRSVFLESNIHAREWISSATSLYIINELLTSKNVDIRKLADGYDWYIVPVFNPDGFVYTHQRERLWRKTRVPYGSCQGADPNRNWDSFWNEGGSSSEPCSDVYAGPNAFSEPCVKSLSDFISTIGDKLVAYISFHSYAQVLLIPYGTKNVKVDNYDQLMSIGQASINALSERFGTPYEVGNIVDILYVATGGSMDWVKQTFNTTLTFTYELRDTGRHGFILPAAEIEPTSLEIIDSLITMFQQYELTKTK